jgi:superfamily II DNA/RNA helicase
MVFCNTKKRVDELTSALQTRGTPLRLYTVI